MNIKNTMKIYLKDNSYNNGDIVFIDDIIFQILNKIKEFNDYTEYEGVRLINYD